MIVVNVSGMQRRGVPEWRLGAARFSLPLVSAALVFGVLAQGAYYPAQAAVLAGLTSAAALAGFRGAIRQVAPVWVAAAVMAAALFASSAAAHWPGESLLTVLTLVAAIAACVAARNVVIAQDREQLVLVVCGLAAAAAAVGMAGLALHLFPFAMRAQGIWRTSSTLTYANSAGALFAMSLPFALLRCAEGPTRARRLCVFLITTGLLTSLSRGAVLGALVALVLQARATPGVLVKSRRPVLSAALATAFLVPSMLSDEPHALLALTAVLVCAAVASSVRSIPGVGRVPVVLGALALVLLGVAAIAVSDHAGLFVAKRVGPGSEDRLGAWGVSVAAGMERPVLGSGPGTYRVVEVVGDRLMLRKYAHNEVLQAFVETGAVGAGVLVGSVVGLAIWAWRRRPEDRAERSVWAAAVGGCAAFAVHGMFDFVWHVPVLTALAFALLGLGVIRPRAACTRGGGGT
ncbi:MAG: O-antigen ligase family protein [Actinomycetota bacterium]